MPVGYGITKAISGHSESTSWLDADEHREVRLRSKGVILKWRQGTNSSIFFF